MPLKKVVIECSRQKIMDIPCPVKDNHQHGPADLKEGSDYDLTLTIGISINVLN
jgi:hypothetical protein